MGSRMRRLGLETVSRPIHGLVSVSSRSRSRSQSQAHCYFHSNLFITKTLCPHKLNRSVNNNPCRMRQNSTICTESVLHRCNIWRHLCLRKYLLLKWRVNSVITLKMNQQEDRDQVSDVIQFEQAVLCPATLSSSDFYGTSKFCSKWACFQQSG